LRCVNENRHCTVSPPDKQLARIEVVRHQRLAFGDIAAAGLAQEFLFFASAETSGVTLSWGGVFDIFFRQLGTCKDFTCRHQRSLLRDHDRRWRFDHSGSVSQLAEPRNQENHARKHENGAYSEQDIA
jgi:hypothetical protein